MWFEVVGFGVGLLFAAFECVPFRGCRGMSRGEPRSRCMSAGMRFGGLIMAGFGSWVVLRGRCRDCGAGISWRYPAWSWEWGFGAIAVGQLWLALGKDHNGQVGAWMSERINGDYLIALAASFWICADWVAGDGLADAPACRMYLR